MAGAGNCLRGSRVTGDHDAAVCGIKTVAIRKIPGAVSDGKSAHGDIRVFIDNAGMNFMRIDVICVGVSVFQTVDANVDIFYISGLYVARHGSDARRAIEFQRSGTAFDRRCEIEVRQAGSMVRVQVRGEDDFQVLWRERGDVLVSGGSSGAADHAGTEVNEIGLAIHHHGD